MPRQILLSSSSEQQEFYFHFWWRYILRTENCMITMEAVLVSHLLSTYPTILNHRSFQTMGCFKKLKKNSRFYLVTAGKWSWQFMLLYDLMKHHEASGPSMALYPYLIPRWKEKLWSHLQMWTPKNEVSGPAWNCPSPGWQTKAGPAVLHCPAPPKSHIHIPLLMRAKIPATAVKGNGPSRKLPCLFN